MSERTLRLALYCLVGVTALYGAVTFLRGGDGGSVAADSALAAAFGAMAGESQTRFEIAGPTDTLHLARDVEGWTVNGFEADSGAVSRLLRALDEVEVAAVAATNPANHGRLGVTADSAWTLAAGDGATVLLGKTGNRFRTAYARLPDEDVVSLVEGDLRAAAARPLFDWRDKMIVRVDTAAVAGITVVRDGATTAYERQDSAWTSGGEEADETTVRNILQELANMRASGFAPEDAELAGEPERTVVAVDADGNALASLGLSEGDGNFRVTSADSPYTFEIPTFRADRVAPGPPDEE